MSEHNLSSAEINAQRTQRSNAHEGHGMQVRILKGNRPNQVRMPSGKVLTAGGELLRQAVKNGGVILDAPLEVDNGYDEGSVLTLSTPTARRLIERGEAEAV